MMIDQSLPPSNNNYLTEVTAVSKLSGRWFRVVRAAWVVLAIAALGIFVTSLPGYLLKLQGQFNLGSLENPTMSQAVFAMLSGLASLVAALLSLGLALVFFRRRFEETAVAALSFYLLIYGVVMAGPLEEWLHFWFGNSGQAATIQAVLLAFPSVALFVFFPNGRFVPNWTRWLLLLAVPWSASLAFLPLYDGAAITGLPVVGGTLMVMWSVSFFFAGVYAQVYRYRQVSTLTEQQQTKWVIYGFGLWMVYVLLSTGPYYYLTGLPPNAPIPWWAGASKFGWFLSLNIIPVSLAIAVTRYRLWNIDILINRTLVYGALTAVGVAIYVLVVVSVGVVFQQGSDWANLLLTAVLVIFLFRPLRSRLQLGANKWAPIKYSQPIPVVPTPNISQIDGEDIVDDPRDIEIPQTKPWFSYFLWGVGMAVVSAGLVLLALNWDTSVPPRWGFRGFQQLNAIPILAGGLIIASRRPRNPIGWLSLASGLVAAFIGLGEEYAAYALLTRPGLLPGGEIIAGLANWPWIISMGLGLIYIPLYFPDGRLLSPRWRIVAGLGGAWILLGSVRHIIEPGPLGNISYVINPFAIEKAANRVSWLSLYATLGIGLMIMGIAALSLILRYRRFDGEVRLQIKWVAFAAALVPLSGIIGVYDGWFSDILVFILTSAFSAAIWIAVMRYRLYDIDLLINRTLVYGILTAIIFGLYAIIVGGTGILFQQQTDLAAGLVTAVIVIALFKPLRAILQRGADRVVKVDVKRPSPTNTDSTSIFSFLRLRLWDIEVIFNRALVYGALTACIIAIYALVVSAMGTLFQAQGNWFIALIATGLVAVLFQPMRERWQQWVNQLLYGRRDEPFEVLASLGQRLENSISPETVFPTIVDTVAQTLKLPYVALVVKKGNLQVTTASFGKPTIASDAFPLTYQGAEIGQLLAARRSPDEPFTSGEERLLRNMARQAGTAVHAHQLTTDLQRARQQIVTSREEERRRLRRDLHDGLGPTLASHMLKIGSARALLTERPELTDKLLADMEADLENTLTEVRRIVYDLRPPALDQWGLVGALRAYAETCANGTNPTLAIWIDAPETLPPLSAAVEVAAYYIAREGLTNAVRHAQAQHCTVKLALGEDGMGGNGRLHLKIQDDGCGLPDIVQAGVGFVSMRERAEELGGRWLVETVKGKGVSVTAVLPLGG